MSVSRGVHVVRSRGEPRRYVGSGGVGCGELLLNLGKETRNVFVLNFHHLKMDRTDRAKAAKREPDQGTWKAGIGLGHELNIRSGYSELVAL